MRMYLRHIVEAGTWEIAINIQTNVNLCETLQRTHVNCNGKLNAGNAKEVFLPSAEVEQPGVTIIEPGRR